ncbi:uncharacterized protein [Nicotiana tomentosiformis]|uniref:uncharacterized protein n=1 Tax=Nicotiana tomentosiformis TaxID=4098 RepID=UPI00388C41AA
MVLAQERGQGSDKRSCQFSGQGRHGQFQGQQSQPSKSYYTCGDLRHIARFCPRALGSSQQQGSRAMIPAPAVSSPAQPARGRGQIVRGGCHPFRGLPRDVVQSGEAQPRFYAFPTRPEAESSDVVIKCIVSICHRYASVLFDPGSTYSYVSSYFASYLVVPRDSLSASVSVSIPVGDSIMVDHV